MCFHDIPFSIGMVEGGKVTGFSGPQVCTQFTEVTRFYPNAPWLIVLREQSESLESFRRVANVDVPEDYWQTRCHLISALCAKHQAMTVNFNELDDEGTMRLAWFHLLPGIPFDAQRFNMLCGMNIQQKSVITYGLRNRC